MKLEDVQAGMILKSRFHSEDQRRWQVVYVGETKCRAKLIQKDGTLFSGEDVMWLENCMLAEDPFVTWTKRVRKEITV